MLTTRSYALRRTRRVVNAAAGAVGSALSRPVITVRTERAPVRPKRLWRAALVAAARTG
ncbi:MAG TPA: hypothetical protein VFZ37_10170 [Jiangellaceae bacterium]